MYRKTEITGYVGKVYVVRTFSQSKDIRKQNTYKVQKRVGKRNSLIAVPVPF